MKRVFVSLCLALLCITMTSCSVFTEYAVKDGVSSKTTSSTVSSEIYVPSLPEGDRLENPKDSYYNSEAQLSLLGLGPKTTVTPTLGLMMNWAMLYSAHTNGSWWAYFPVILTITLISFSLNLMNTGLDQVFNPTLRD